MWDVYVLVREKKGRIYVGFTEDLKRRFKEHNYGNVASTKGYRPYKLAYYEAFVSKADAAKEEKFLKSGYGREVLQDKIASSLELCKANCPVV